MTNPLEQLPPKVRRIAYTALGFAAIGLAAWQAGEGDWALAATYALGSLGFGVATTHTPREPE